MKKLQYVLGMIACCIIMILSCSKSNDVSSSALLPELVQAEEIMYESPDSALHILQTMPAPQPSDKLQYATWALFMTQAKYKLSINQSDTLIHVACDFFIKSNSSQRKALALYYTAVLNQEKQEIEEAQHSLLEAVKEVEKTNDYQLAHLIYAALGEIYIYRSLSDYALKAYTKAFDYAQKAQNIQQVIASLMYLGRTYGTTGKTDEASGNYRKAIEIASENNEYRLQIIGVHELATIYNKMKKHKSALESIRKGIDLSEKYGLKVNDQQYLTLGKTYNYLAEEDSAELYLKRASLSHNVYTAREAFMLLFKMQKENGHYKEAANNLESSWLCHDSILKIDQSQILIEMQEKYDEQKIINEKNEIEIKKNKALHKALIILIVLLCIIALIVYCYQKKIYLKERMIQDAEDKIRMKSIQIQENESIINRNINYMNELKEQICKNEDIQEQMQEQISSLSEIQEYNEKLEQQNQSLQNDIDSVSYLLKKKSDEIERLKFMVEENIYLRDRENFLSNQLVLQNVLINKMKTAPHYIEIYQWEKVKEATDFIYDNFTKRLSKKIPTLTESDIQICCLIKLHFSNSTIASLLAISPTSVSKRKNRLKERIIQKIGSFSDSQNLDFWIWNF